MAIMRTNHEIKLCPIENRMYTTKIKRIAIMSRLFFASFALWVSVVNSSAFVCGYDGIDNSYNSVTQMMVRLPIPNSTGVYETEAYDGLGDPVMRYAWTSITAPYTNVLPCQNVAHRTSCTGLFDNETYEHGHVSALIPPSFPLYTQFGVPITAADVELAFRRIYTLRLGAGNFSEGGHADVKYNCHSHALDITDHWILDSRPILDCKYEPTVFRTSVKYIGLLGRNSYGRYSHSCKVLQFFPLPSGQGALSTSEKDGESQIFHQTLDANWINPCGSIAESDEFKLK